MHPDCLARAWLALKVCEAVLMPLGIQCAHLLLQRFFEAPAHIFDW